MALKDNGWIGVDLDGTLARYTEWIDAEHIGEPVPAMVGRVKNMLALGYNVRILTARASSKSAKRDLEVAAFRLAADRWTRDVFGISIPVTSEKDFAMIELWDDRAVQVVPNEGLPMGGAQSRVFDLHAERAAIAREYRGGGPS
jgi:hypothetical protein